MNRIFKDDLYEQLARVGKGLANGHRLELIDLICQGERTVDELAREARLSTASASQHLQILHQAHLVKRRRHGTQIRYRIASFAVVGLWLTLRDVAVKQLPDVGQLLEAEFQIRDELEPINQDELERRLSLGEVALIDVRPRLEYLSGHIAGAISIPLEELEARIGELPRQQEIVAYCRGPYCVFSSQAVARLRECGFQARRMELGVPEWEFAKRTVEVGAA